MKKFLLFNIFFFIVTCCYSISISVPQISNNNDLDSIFDVHLESLKDAHFKWIKKTPVPIEDYVFIVSIIGVTREAIGIEQNSYTFHPMMNRKDLFRLKKWYKKNKFVIPQNCFIEWWNLHSNPFYNLEDLEKIEDCVMK